MKVVRIICAEHNIIDAQTGDISCINLVEDIRSQQFPVLLQRFSTLITFEKEPHDDEENSALLAISLDQKELFRAPLLVGFADSNVSRSLNTLRGLGIIYLANDSPKCYIMA